MSVGSASNFSAELGRQQFMDLFVAQLQYQDPLEPVGQQEFLQQLAQFSTVEGIENLNAQFDSLAGSELISRGASLVGREVTTSDGDTGVVASAKVEEGQILVRVGDDLIPVSALTEIGGTPDHQSTSAAESEEISNSDREQLLATGAALVNKNAVWFDPYFANTSNPPPLSGRILGVAVVDGSLHAEIEGATESIPVADLVYIGEGQP